MASGNLLYDAGSSNPVLCDNLETLHGMRGGRKFKTGELCVYLWLIHVDVWQKLTQYCKAIILQLKNKIKKQTRRSNSEKAMAPHSSTLAWKIPWTEEPSRLQSMGSRSQTQLSDFTFISHSRALEKEMATHSSVLAWTTPGTGEPSGLPSMGSPSQTQLKRLSSSSTDLVPVLREYTTHLISFLFSS